MKPRKLKNALVLILAVAITSIAWYGNSCGPCPGPLPSDLFGIQDLQWKYSEDKIEILFKLENGTGQVISEYQLVFQVNYSDGTQDEILVMGYNLQPGISEFMEHSYLCSKQIESIVVKNIAYNL